ncbi:MAG TPA: DinB family protein [Bryobacteraceae bacterium]|nr:DinB family protein [Bryobacteraceae bacterium]
MPRDSIEIGYNRFVKIAAVALTIAFAANVAAGPLEKNDRERILTELQTSRKQLLDAVSGLTLAQWTYKAGPDRWSIAEVAEHIIAAETYLGTMVTQQIMRAPADPGKAEARQPKNTAMDEGFLVQLRDRSKKAQAPGEIVPKGIYKTPAEAVMVFTAARDKTINYVQTTQDALRDHFFAPFPGAELDGVQGLLMIAGHNERHVLQMLEVKQAAGYPK